MKKLSRREIIILSLTIGLAVIFILLQWIIKPLGVWALHIDDQIRLDHHRLIKDRTFVAMKDKLDGRYQYWVDMFGLKQTESLQITSMALTIESVARQTNVHIANIQPQATTRQKNVQLFPLELDIEGTWPDVVKFIYLLQQRPNYYFLAELNLERYSQDVNSLRGRMVVSCMRLVSAGQNK